MKTYSLFFSLAAVMIIVAGGIFFIGYQNVSVMRFLMFVAIALIVAFLIYAFLIHKPEKKTKKKEEKPEEKKEIPKKEFSEDFVDSFRPPDL